MLHGMYDFAGTNDKTLSFQLNESLLYLGPHPKTNNWLRASNARGQVGIVPVNYITIGHDYNGDNVMEFLNGAIRRSQRDKSPKLDELLNLRDRLLNSTTDLKDQIIELEDEIRRSRQIAIAELGGKDVSYLPKDSQELLNVKRTSMPTASPTLSSSSSRKSVNAEFSEGRSLESGNSEARGLETRKSESRSLDVRALDGIGDYDNLVSSTTRTASASESAVSGASGLTYVVDKPKYTHSRMSFDKEESDWNTHTPSQGAMSMSSMRAASPATSIATAISGFNTEPITPAPSQSSIVPCRLAGELIEGVRNSTGLSHELSQIAVQTVLQFLQGHFQGISEQLNSLIGYLEMPCAIRQYPSIIAQSTDAIQLRKVFNQLTECKDDEQQRSWALHEDEGMILENVKQLNAILDKADQSISKFVMQENHYTSVHALVLYYQMETRWSIRQVLLESFAFMSIIDGRALSVLLNSILPMELARELQLNGCELERLVKTANLLALLLSTGEPMPITHYEHLGTDFLHFILTTIENPPNDDERVTDVFMNVVLAYNLEFKTSENNFTIQALAEISNAKVFTQKMIYLLNWEKDPLALEYAHESIAPNSVFKLLTDIFTCAKTADLFYQNDVKVLIDIVTRCLTDLGPGDKRRTAYLNLIRAVFRNSNYNEHRHRREDLVKCFTSIMMEDDPLAVPDQKLLKEITQEFPAIIK